MALGILIYFGLFLFPATVPEERIGNGGVVAVGYVLVESDPQDAAVLVDGEIDTRTPDTIELPVGRHHLVIEKQGYRTWEAWVEVKQSVRTDIHADLVRLTP